MFCLGSTGSQTFGSKRVEKAVFLLIRSASSGFAIRPEQKKNNMKKHAVDGTSVR